MNINYLKDIVKAATDRPWHAEIELDGNYKAEPGGSLGAYFATGPRHVSLINSSNEIILGTNDVREMAEKDARYIATFNPQLVQKLLDVVEDAKIIMDKGPSENNVLDLDKSLKALELVKAPIPE